VEIHGLPAVFVSQPVDIKVYKEARNIPLLHLTARANMALKKNAELRQ